MHLAQNHWFTKLMCWRNEIVVEINKCWKNSCLSKRDNHSKKLKLNIKKVKTNTGEFSGLTFMNLLVCFEVSNLRETSFTQSALVRFLSRVHNKVPSQRGTSRKLLSTCWTNGSLWSPSLFFRSHCCCRCWMADPPVDFQASANFKCLSAVVALVKWVFAMFLSQMAVSGVHALETLAAFCAADELLRLSSRLTFRGCRFRRMVTFRFGGHRRVCVTR